GGIHIPRSSNQALSVSAVVSLGRFGKKNQSPGGRVVLSRCSLTLVRPFSVIALGTLVGAERIARAVLDNEIVRSAFGVRAASLVRLWLLGRFTADFGLARLVHAPA